MFTGIVEETGKVQTVTDRKIVIECHEVLENTKIGDSIAVNGVCLTVTEIGKNSFSADISPETFKVSCKLKLGDIVNLERAMSANGRFGGHIVSGHVDGTGIIQSIKRDDNAIWYTIKAAPEVLRFIVEKGSITIDGISLTVARVDDLSFAISAIPHTVAVTILSDKKVGDIVNLENDIIGKYVEKLMGLSAHTENVNAAPKSKITEEFLIEYGF